MTVLCLIRDQLLRQQRNANHENRSRSLWRLGRVMHLVRGNDGKVRGAKVKVAERGKKPTTLRRPIQKLYPIEIGNQDITQQKLDMGSTINNPTSERRVYNSETSTRSSNQGYRETKRIDTKRTVINRN